METSERFAQTILNGFESFFAEFQNITLAAKPRFENADWQGVHAASRERIDLRKGKVSKVMEYVRIIAGDHLHDLVFWTEAKAHYERLVRGHNNFEIAETFFNSVYCSTFQHRKIRNDYAFVFSSQGDMPPVTEARILRNYRAPDSLEAMFTRLLDDYAFSIPWEENTKA